MWITLWITGRIEKEMQREELDEFLEKTKELLKGEVTKISYETWIKDLELQSMDNNTIVLVAHTQFQKDSIMSRYYELFKNTFKYLTNKEWDITVILNEDNEDEQESSISQVGQYTQTLNSNLNPKYTFESFVVGNNNRFAHAAALAVAEAPATSYNPLFLYGGVGLGKTHLMHAIANEILVHNKNTSILYVTSEKFTNQLINAIKDNKNEQFRNKYRNIDVLLIDDIQFIAGKERIQEEFFHTFNNLYNDSKQIIVSSDRSPEDLKVLEDRLRTRFAWGLQVDISPPDYDLKVAIIKKKLKREDVVIGDDVISYIASNIGNDVRQLEGSITRLVAYSAIMCVTNITTNFAMEALKDFVKKDAITDQNNIRRIQKSVANFYKISFEDMKSKKRTPNLAIPRQVAMYLCRKLTDESFERIGIEFGGKNHATVMHSCNKIETSLKSNMELKEAIIHIEQELK